MAGHSQFRNIMYRKKAVDARRSTTFSKHARLIMTAARAGGGDPASNIALRYAIDRARLDNMSKDAIARAVDKGAGGGEGSHLEAITYEGYGPGGVAILVDALTDNRHRTVTDVRSALVRHGGNLGESGSVAWNFERKALFSVAAPAEREEALLLLAMEAGAWCDCWRRSTSWTTCRRRPRTSNGPRGPWPRPRAPEAADWCLRHPRGCPIVGAHPPARSARWPAHRWMRRDSSSS